MNKVFLVMAVITLLCPVWAAQAAPILWSSNGHYYEFVYETKGNWNDAKVAAASRVYNGFAGHLLTVTSAAEQSWLVQNLYPTYNFNPWAWIGAYQDASAPDYQEPNGGWKWVTGESFAYNGWTPGTPNNLGGAEDCAVLRPDGAWDDVRLNYFPYNYVVEYEAVPEPSGILALLGGVAGICSLVFRRSK